MRAAAFPYIFPQQRSSLFPEGGGGGAADAEVRDWSSAGADPASPRVGGCRGAAAGFSAGEKPGGGELRPELNPGGSVRRGAAREGDGSRSPKPNASGGAWPGTVTNLLRVKQSMHTQTMRAFLSFSSKN